jgi:hypothetical protein
VRSRGRNQVSTALLSDTVVKLRPVIPAEPPARLRAREEFVVEIDTMPGSYVSGKQATKTRKALRYFSKLAV